MSAPNVATTPDEMRAHLQRTLIEKGVPEHVQDGLVEWVMTARPMGHCLTAIVSNDLKETFNRADDQVARRLKEIVMWFYNDAPAECWGNEQRFKAWRKRGGLLEYDPQTRNVRILTEKEQLKRERDALLAVIRTVRQIASGMMRSDPRWRPEDVLTVTDRWSRDEQDESGRAD